MIYGSVCSGIEAASVAWEPLGGEGQVVAGTLAAGAHPGCYNGQDAYTGNIVAHLLRADGFDASEDGTGRGTPLVPVLCANETGQGWWNQGDVAGTLRAEGENRPSRPSNILAFPLASRRWAVRRLTPRECERLQGFPDDWTLIPYRGKPAADGPRYKAIGNSMAVNVMRWIGRRIELVGPARH